MQSSHLISFHLIPPTQVTSKEGRLGLKHFRPIKPLGAGDTGSVHLVELKGTNCLFAMKAMDKEVMINRNKVGSASREGGMANVGDCTHEAELKGTSTLFAVEAVDEDQEDEVSNCVARHACMCRGGKALKA